MSMFGFVRKNVYDKLLSKVSTLEYDLESANRTSKTLRNLWYSAADQVQKLESKVMDCNYEIYELRKMLSNKTSNDEQFTKDELRSLLQLVHPDKHNGKASAVALTQKINKLRG